MSLAISGCMRESQRCCRLSLLRLVRTFTSPSCVRALRSSYCVTIHLPFPVSLGWLYKPVKWHSLPALTCGSPSGVSLHNSLFSLFLSYKFLPPHLFYTINLCLKVSTTMIKHRDQKQHAEKSVCSTYLSQSVSHEGKSGKKF